MKTLESEQRRQFLAVLRAKLILKRLSIRKSDNDAFRQTELASKQTYISSLMVDHKPVQSLLLNSKNLLFLILLISGASIIGWLLEISLLDSTKYIPIAPATAIVFLILCLLFFPIGNESRIYLRIRKFAFYAVVVFCLWIIISYRLKLPWDIENLFIKNPDRFGNIFKGRMSPVSAWIFLTVCLGYRGMISRSSEWLKYIGGTSSSLVFVVSFVLLTGYLYETPLLYGGIIIPVALPSAICFLLLSLYLLFNYELKYFTLNLIGENKIKLQLLSWFLPIVTLAMVVQGFFISYFKVRGFNPTLTANLILLILLAVTCFVIVKVSNLLGKRITTIENSLRASELQLSTLIKTIPDLVWLKDTEGKFLLANPTLERYFGTPENEILGKTDSDFLDPNLAAYNVEQDHKVMERGKTLTYEEWITFPDTGQRTFLETKKMPMIDSNGSVIGVLGISRDITSHKTAEENLKIAKQKAEESERLKSAFLANMSHEIRTPMNGILGFAELFKDADLSDEEKGEYIGLIQKSGERMLNIINDIISISKLDSGLMQIRLTETNVNDQVRYIYSFFKPEAEKKGINLRFFIPLPDKEAVLITDKEKLYAVLTNLVKNALKFTNEGAIEVGYEKKDSALEFFVRDSGIGIPPEQQELIFERFRQGSESLTRNYEGAGLGLSISRAYVIMQGGKMWVKSSPGEGSVFYFTLPVNPEQKGEESIPSRNPAQDGEVHPVKKIKILITEDDKTSAHLLTNIVKPFAKEVLKAETGIEAVETARLHPDLDLILMDIKLPGMNGYEAVKKIRVFNSRAVIVAQTAFALPEDHSRALEAGCNDYIAKPVSRAVLKEKMEKYFG